MDDRDHIDIGQPAHRSGLTRHELLRLAAVLGVSATALGATACGSSGSSGASGGASGGSPRKGGTLHAAFSDASSKEGLDPGLTTLNNDSCYCGQIYECLTQQDESWNVHPVLAENWTANSAVTEWTFSLRKGVRFHDGTPLTSKDVAYSIKRQLDKNYGSALYARLSESLDPAGVQTPDDHTVVLKMKRPDSLMPLALAERQAKIVKDGTSDFTARTAIGTGPFKLKSWSPGQSWSLVRNPTYWDAPLPYLDGIQTVVIGEQSTKVQSVVSGSNDLCDPIDFSAASSVTGQASLLVFHNSTYLDIAMDQTVKPFTDPRVVMAVKLAQDRKQILTAAFQGYGSETSDAPEPTSDPYFPPSLGVRAQNIAKAKQLLADAGYANGIDLELFTSPSAGGMVDIAVAFQQVVKPAGIRVSIRQWPAATYWDQVWLTKPMYVSYYNRRHPEEILAVTYLSNAPWNESKLNDPQLSNLVSQGLATADKGKQTTIWQQALARVADTHGTAIPVFYHRLWVRKNQVQGAQPDLQNSMYFKNAYLT